jgi:Ca-activated chloride channel family protein
MTLRARSDRRLIRATHRSERFVLVEVTAPQAPPPEPGAVRTPVNLALVLDRSGSMSGPKIELAKQAIETAIARLHHDDRFAIVAYDDAIDVVVESTPASGEARQNAMERLRAIDARGSTDLGGGWLRGAEQVALHLAERGVNRVLLLTDGLANRGITDPGELGRHAAELRARGVTTSTFGVGEDFDEGLLQALADAGGGHFYFIADARQIADHISSEVGELLEVTATDAAIEVMAAAGVEIESLSPYAVETRGHRWRLLLGDLVAEQRVEVVLRLRFGYGAIGHEVGLLIGLVDRDAIFAAGQGSATVPLAWTYADDRANDTQPRDRGVDRAVARVFAARARQAAIASNRGGRFDVAAAGLFGVAERIAGYAGDDPELQAIVAELREEQVRWSAPAPEMARKVAFAGANYAMRTRGPSGRASR